MFPYNQCRWGLLRHLCGNGYAYDRQVCSKRHGGATDGTRGPAANGTVCLPANGDRDLPDLCDARQYELQRPAG